jgi:hypothetical protein
MRSKTATAAIRDGMKLVDALSCTCMNGMITAVLVTTSAAVATIGVRGELLALGDASCAAVRL